MTTPAPAAVLQALPFKPGSPRPVVSYTVNVNSHYQSTPYEVMVTVRAASADQATDALDKAFEAVEAQLNALQSRGYVPRG